MAGDDGTCDGAGEGVPDDPQESADATEQTAVAVPRAEARRLQPLASRAWAALTGENAQALARQAKAFAQSEQTARAAKVIGGVVASAIISKHLKPGGVTQGAVAAALAAGLNGAQRTSASGAPDAVSPEADWAPASWQPPRAASAAAQRRYPSEPGLLHLGFSGSGQLFKHPDLPDLWVESTLLGLNDPAVSFEWEPAGARRSHLRGPDVSTSWEPVECTGQMLPLELRRVTDTDVEFRWLEPTPAQLSVTKSYRPPPVDPEVVARRMKTALDATNIRPRWRV